MLRFKNILLYAHADNGDQETFDRAVALAQKNGAKLTVCDVVQELPAGISEFEGIFSDDELKAMATEQAQERLDALVATNSDSAIKVSTKILSGTPFIEIIRQVIRNHHDLVVKTAEQPGGFRKRLFGSTGRHLMRKCPCPVWVLKPGHGQSFSRILAAIDAADEDPSHCRLNVMIMELAASLAETEESELHVLHAWELWGESMLSSGRGRLPEDELHRILKAHEAKCRDALDNLVSPFDLSKLESETHLIKGDPAYVISAFAEDREIDLIVMGTVGRIGIAGFFIGNTAEKVLDQVNCSVLALKPAGFGTPVKL